MKFRNCVRGMVVAGLAVAGCLASPAFAQSASVGPVSSASIGLQRQALGKLMKIMSVEYSQTRLESVLKNIVDATGAPLDILWADDRNPIGLDKEALVTFTASDVTALTVLEAVLARAAGDVTSGGNSWQMTEAGQIEVGPKERLNRTRRLEIYDVSDLLLEIYDYSDVPQFDLNGALQAAGGGGGGGGSSSPFSGATQQKTNTGKTEQERADDLIRIIVDLIEPQEWTNNGGSAANVRYYKKSLLVTAPDYIQRQINGYPFWPAEQTRVEQDKHGRKVTLLPPRKGSGVVQTAKVSPSTPSVASPTTAAGQQPTPTEGH